METIDLTAEIEQPKPKAKSRAKAKAEPVVEESVPLPEPQPKAKGRAKAKAKAKAAPAEEEPVVAAAVEEPVPEVAAVEEPAPAIASPDGAANEPPTEPTPEVVEAETTTRKPKGHRPKIENKEKLTKKVSCKKCDKTVSLHSIKYTHDKFCKSEEPSTAASSSSSFSAPPTLRERLQEKRMATAQRLISQCFKA
jgi:hypothetical protein